MRKILLDAQLPRQLKSLFTEFGFQALHTLDLPEGNRTKDNELIRLSTDEDSIIVTKDSDFVESHLLRGLPRKLLLISCGNISNTELSTLLRTYLPHIVLEFEENNYIELSREDLIIH
ncbi:MAG: DUF5615 family PIN-like protein [Ignavibacteriota bacterium]